MNGLRFAVAGLLIGALAACESSGSDTTGSGTVSPDSTAFAAKLSELDAAVDVWRSAETIDAARVAAETAANLVVGSNGPAYGDRNGDGSVSGETSAGILPGLDGTPPGAASPLADTSCITRDVLGGSWDDPAARWDQMNAAITDWRPDANTMPTLTSHPMRVVGWSTFTLDIDPTDPEALDLAHEYAGHAALHVAISSDALDC